MSDERLLREARVLAIAGWRLLSVARVSTAPDGLLRVEITFRREAQQPRRYGWHPPPQDRSPAAT